MWCSVKRYPYISLCRHLAPHYGVPRKCLLLSPQQQCQYYAIETEGGNCELWANPQHWQHYRPRAEGNWANKIPSHKHLFSLGWEKSACFRYSKDHSVKNYPKMSQLRQVSGVFWCPWILALLRGILAWNWVPEFCNNFLRTLRVKGRTQNANFVS